MKKHTTSLLILATLLLLLPPAARSRYGDRIFRLDDRMAVGLSQILDDLRQSPLIFIGEQHSSPDHHALQLRIIRTLHNLEIPLAVGLEMFTARDQDYLEDWVNGRIPEPEFVRIYEDNWGKTWDLYRSIFLYARKNRIPLVGLNVPEEITVQVAREGFGSLSKEQLSELPGVSCDVSDRYRDFIRLALSMHGSDLDTEAGRTSFENFCEAQLVWDASMAFRLVQYSEENPSRKVVVLAGVTHAWKPGIPDQVERFNGPSPNRVILPEIPPAQTRNRIDATLADYLWLKDMNSGQ